MPRTDAQERTRVENITLMVLNKSNPAIAMLFENQRRNCRPDHAQANRLKTAQTAWMHERRNNTNPPNDIEDEFHYQKKQYLDFGHDALCPEPLTDGSGLVTMAANGLMTGLQAEKAGPHDSDAAHAQARAMHTARQKELVRKEKLQLSRS